MVSNAELARGARPMAQFVMLKSHQAMLRCIADRLEADAVALRAAAPPSEVDREAGSARHSQTEAFDRWYRNAFGEEPGDLPELREAFIAGWSSIIRARLQEGAAVAVPLANHDSPEALAAWLDILGQEPAETGLPCQDYGLEMRRGFRLAAEHLRRLAAGASG